MNLKDILFMTRAHTVKPDAELFDILLAKKLDQGIIRTIKGNPLRFSARKAQKAQNPSLFMLPIQDLHGYDRPWVGGAGKNKSSINSVSLVKGTTDSVEEACAPIPAGDYIITNTPSGTATVVRITFLDENKSSLGTSGTITNSPVNITISGTAYYLRVYIGSSNPNGNTFSTSDLMVRSASETDATFAPYENICPISGRDSAEIIHDNENVLKWRSDIGLPKTTNGIRYSNAGDGKVQLENTATATSFLNLTDSSYGTRNFKPNTTYYFKLFGAISGVTLQLYVDSMSVGNASEFSYTFPPSFETAYVRIRVANGTSFTTPLVVAPMISIGQSPTGYVINNEVTIDFTFGQTVYGGAINLDTGVLTVGWDIVDMGTLKYGQSTGIVQLSKNTIQKTTGKNPKRVADDGSICDAWDCYTTANNTYFYTDILAENFPTVASGHYLCYPLETPQTIQLTPQEINLLKGINNIWTDGDTIELTYRA